VGSLVAGGLAVVLLWVVLPLAWMASLGWPVMTGDWWGLRWMGLQMQAGQPATWHSGFYPVGALAVFGALPAAWAHVWAQGVSVACGLVAGLAGARWAARQAGGKAGLWVLAGWTFLPGVWVARVMQNADLLALAPLALGVMVWQGGRLRGPGAVMAGVLLGAGCLVRWHLALLVVPWVVVSGVQARGRARGYEATVLATLLATVALVEGPIHRAATGQWLHTWQKFNVYKAIHGIEWTRVMSLPWDQPWSRVLLDDPAATLRTWVTGTLLALLAGSGVLWAAWRTRGMAEGAPWRGAAVGVGVYAAVGALGLSSRAPIPLWWLSAVALAVLTGVPAAPRPGRRPRKLLGSWSLAGLAGPLVLAGAWQVADLDRVHRAHAEARRAVHAWLLAQGVDAPGEVFVDEFALYRPGAQVQRWRHNGGWVRLDSPAYHAAWPELCVDDATCFEASARATGVRWLVLGPRAGRMGPGVGAWLAAAPAPTVRLGGYGVWGLGGVTAPAPVPAGLSGGGR
jgi:hypothetical protein